MTFYLLKDGWLDESREGPYTETLHTFGSWRIVRLFGETDFSLYKKSVFINNFSTISEAKDHVTKEPKC